MKPAISFYKGHPVLCLNPAAKFKFSFGLSKAKMILENLEAIKAFVAGAEPASEELFEAEAA